MVPMMGQQEQMKEDGNSTTNDEGLSVVMAVGRIITGMAVLMEEDSLQVIEVPTEFLPEAQRRVGARLVWRMNGSVNKETIAKERFAQLQRAIKTMFSKKIEFAVGLKYIMVEGESCKVSFVWTPLKQLLHPFKLISLDVYCGDTLLRIGVNADGGIHSVLDAEESELVVGGLEMMQVYAFKFVARTNTGDYEGGTFKVRGLEEGLKGYGIYCASQDEVMMAEVKELTTRLGGVWIENQGRAEVNYFVIGEAEEDPDRLIDIMSIEWLRALKAGSKQ